MPRHQQGEGVARVRGRGGAGGGRQDGGVGRRAPPTVRPSSQPARPHCRAASPSVADGLAVVQAAHTPTEPVSSALHPSELLLTVADIECCWSHELLTVWSLTVMAGSWP